jgi:hypothetical protein
MLASSRFALAAITACVLATTARAQDVVVCWGDSILAGFNSTGDTSTPYGPAPFGDPLPGALRWSATTQTWEPITPFQNHFGTSADPMYGFAAGWRRFHGGDLYIISLALSGSDVSPLHPNPPASWHPSVGGGAYDRFKEDHLTPALESLPAPDLRAVLFNAGNNFMTPTLIADIDAVNAEIAAFVTKSTPRFLGVKTYLGTANDPQTLVQRQAMADWAAMAPDRYTVETLSIPGRTGGLFDGFHLSHFGSIFLGFWSAVTEFFEL